MVIQKQHTCQKFQAHVRRGLLKPAVRYINLTYFIKICSSFSDFEIKISVHHWSHFTIYHSQVFTTTVIKNFTTLKLNRLQWVNFFPPIILYIREFGSSIGQPTYSHGTPSPRSFPLLSPSLSLLVCLHWMCKTESLFNAIQPEQFSYWFYIWSWFGCLPGTHTYICIYEMELDYFHASNWLSCIFIQLILTTKYT